MPTFAELENRIEVLEYAQLATNDFIADLVALLVKKKQLSLGEIIKLIEFQRELLPSKEDDDSSAHVAFVQQNLDDILYNAVLECPNKNDPHRLSHLSATLDWIERRRKS